MASLSLANVPSTKAKAEPAKFKIVINEIQRKNVSKEVSYKFRNLKTTTSTTTV